MEEKELKQRIFELAAPIVKAQRLEIWGLEIVGGPRVTLRLFVETPGSAVKDTSGTVAAGIDECEKISRQLDLALEVEGCFKGPWTLEVSTPGFSRRFFTLEQIIPYKGDIVEARLAAPLVSYPGEPSVIRGRLAAIDGSRLVIEPCAISKDGEIISENLPPASFSFEDARRISRIHVFTLPPKPGGKKNRKG